MKTIENQCVKDLFDSIKCLTLIADGLSEASNMQLPTQSQNALAASWCRQLEQLRKQANKIEVDIGSIINRVKN